MVSKYTKLGGALLILSISLTIMINVLQVPIPFATGTYGKSSELVPIPSNGTYVDILLGEVNNPIHPFTTYLSAIYGLKCENGQLTAKTMLLYSDSSTGLGQIPWTENTYFLNSESGESEITRTIPYSLNGKYAARKYSIYLRVSCDINDINTGNLTLEYRELKANFMFFTAILPSLSGFAGIIIMIAGFVINYRKMAKGKPLTVKPEWEPRLQWDGSSSSKKQLEKTPRMAIKTKKSSTRSKTIKKTIEKVKPESGPSIACKFCGKKMPRSAFFCPHCYGKIR